MSMHRQQYLSYDDKKSAFRHTPTSIILGTDGSDEYCNLMNAESTQRHSERVFVRFYFLALYTVRAAKTPEIGHFVRYCGGFAAPQKRLKKCKYWRKRCRKMCRKNAANCAAAKTQQCLTKWLSAARISKKNIQKCQNQFFSAFPWLGRRTRTKLYVHTVQRNFFIRPQIGALWRKRREGRKGLKESVKNILRHFFFILQMSL